MPRSRFFQDAAALAALALRNGAGLIARLGQPPLRVLTSSLRSEVQPLSIMVHDLLALDQGMSNLIPIEILRSRVAREIRAAILRGELAPGSHVKQEELAAQLGVSREPVRQALLVLQREGLVLAQPNRRAMVAPLDRQLINDVYGFREAVENTVVAMLARLPAFDVTPLREIIARGRAAVGQGDLSELLHLDMIFHTTMYEAAGNRVIVEVMHGQWSHIRRLLEMVLGRANYRQKVWDEHEAIVNELAARRVAAARNVTGRHIRSARRMLLSVFGTTSAATSAARGRRDEKLTP